MPMSDAVLYLHGSGSAAGPLTSTAVTLTGVSQALTTLTYTVATGQVIPGQTFKLAGGAPTVSQWVTIVAILTGGGGTGTATVNVSQTVTTTTATGSPNITGDAITVDGYSNLELDFGAPSGGQAYPWMAQFPSLTEKGYTNPPEVVGQGGADFGIHVIVTSPFAATVSINFQVVTASHTSALIGDPPNPIASRLLTLAQLQVAGAHYYIGVPGAAVLEFLRVFFDVTTTATFGTVVVYYGPRTGGEL